MDRGAPHWVFGASVVFMVLTVAFALIGDRRSADRLRPLIPARRHA
jgi:ABC-type dipeptide/oligopeptide/nickel transport system permease subunit